MLIQQKTKCVKCGKEFFVAAPYGTYHCDRCGKLLGSICSSCLSEVKCSCGGKPIDKTDEWAAKNHILF